MNALHIITIAEIHLCNWMAHVGVLFAQFRKAFSCHWALAPALAFWLVEATVVMDMMWHDALMLHLYVNLVLPPKLLRVPGSSLAFLSPIELELARLCCSHPWGYFWKVNWGGVHGCESLPLECEEKFREACKPVSVKKLVLGVVINEMR